MQYTTKDGEKLDVICWQNYGSTKGTFEAVLFSPENYDATTAEIFSAGTVIELPPVEPAKRKAVTRLWE